MTGAERPPAGYYPFAVGSLRCASVSDGYFVGKVEIPAVEIGVEEVVGHLRRRGRDPERLRSQLSCLVISDREAGRTALIDTGIGAMPGPAGVPSETAGRLVDNLRAADVDPGEIDTVLISHLHRDHIGGAFDADDEPVFPNATFHLGREEVDFWSGDDPDLSGNLAPPSFREASVAFAQRFLRLASGRTETFELGEEILPGIVAVAVPGHTPGQSAFLIGSGEDALLYTADAFGDPVISIEKPGWRFFGDADSPIAVATRERLIAELRGERRRFFTPHFPWPNLGRIGAVDEHAVWMPEPYTWS
jgi:glyoxylase-like metal-dependent hydrolase (beta-lactamase superfamily II)